MPDTKVFAAAKLDVFAREVLRRAGADDVDARMCAESMTDASLRGIDSHGIVALLPRFAADARASTGALSPPGVTAQGPVVRVSGNGALGPRTGRAAVDGATAQARELGVGVAIAAGVGYLGALSWLVSDPAESGLIALATCNGMAFVAPHGGNAALHGTNPIAVGIPAAPDPLILDMRTNAFAMDDFYQALSTGKPLPPDALHDESGNSISDAGSIVKRGWDGIVSGPMAGPRGYGLALAVDVLTAALAGGLIGREINSEHERDSLSLFVLALDPSAFGSRDRFASAVQRLLAQIAATPPSGPDPVRYPGERAAAERRKRLATGIPVDVTQWQRMLDELDAVGVLPPEPPPMQDADYRTVRDSRTAS